MKKVYIKYLPAGAGLLAILLILAAVIYGILQLQKSQPKAPKMVVQNIKLLKPPPPPKMEEQKPPPPQQPKQEIEQPKPEDTPPDQPDTSQDLPPLGEDLGLDALGGAGGDMFGLVGRKGGRDLIGGGGSEARWYAGVIQQEISEALSDNDAIRKDRYSVVVYLWITADGVVKHYKIEKSTGKPALDKKLEVALSGLSRLSEPPPANLPQPIKLRISSRL